MIVIGKIGSPHGIKGAAKLLSFANPPENIEKYKIFTKNGSNYTELSCKITTLHSNKLIINIQDCEDRNKISEFTNTLLYTDIKCFEKNSPDEYFWEELIGLKILDRNQDNLGTVIKIIETGSHDVLVFKETATYLIPFIQGKSVLNIDFSTKSITIDQDYAIKN